LKWRNRRLAMTVALRSQRNQHGHSLKCLLQQFDNHTVQNRDFRGRNSAKGALFYRN